MVQPWVTFGTTFQSPKLFTTLPSGSNSMNGGACCAISASLSVLVIPINNENVILFVHTYAAHLSVYPVVRQRPWPAGIDHELRAMALRLHATEASQGGQEP